MMATKGSRPALLNMSPIGEGRGIFPESDTLRIDYLARITGGRIAEECDDRSPVHAHLTHKYHQRNRRHQIAVVRGANPVGQLVPTVVFDGPLLLEGKDRRPVISPVPVFWSGALAVWLGQLEWDPV